MLYFHMILYSVHTDLRPFHIVLNACNATGRLPPKSADCEALHSANPGVAFISGNFFPSFLAPRNGNYTITVAGAQGGEGACSRMAGRGVKVHVQHVFLSKDELIVLRIGQKGTAACDTNPTHPVCQLDESAEDFEEQCLEVLRNMTPTQWQLFDGGGGGGGKTEMARVNEAFVNRFIIVAAGGGGAAAIPSNTTISPDGQTSSSEFFSNGKRIGNATVFAGVGGGGALANTLAGQLPVDGNQPLHSGKLLLGGGSDCLGNPNTSFPETEGGFGGGGGGCGNGGGGGGWIGGNVVAEGNTFPGTGGTSIIAPPVMETTLSFHEDGNGFAEFFFEKCSCTFECLPDFEEQLFSCLCPIGTQLAQDGLDCLRGMYWGCALVQ